MLNYDFIRKKAEEAKIDDITVMREYWQLLFLQKLYQLKGSENMIFKGGTAIRFLFNSFRFSEDLDFTAVVSKQKIAELLQETYDFYKKNTIETLEFKKERVWDKFEEESLRYRFLFTPKNRSQKISIRIDVSFREKPIETEKTVLTLFDYPISPYPLVRHLSGQEILAEKIRALFVRGKPRDLFDVWYLLTKKIPLQQKLLSKKFKIYPKLQFSLTKLKNLVSEYKESEIKKDLNQFLPIQYRQFYQQIKQENLKILQDIKAF